MERRAGLVDGDGEVVEGGHGQVADQQSAVGMRRGAEAPGAFGNVGEHVRDGPARLVEQLLGPVRLQPFLELPQVPRVVAHAGQRHLVGAPGALDGPAVHLGGAGPALRGAQHDHGPARTLGRALLAGGALRLGDAVQGGVHGPGQGAVDGGGVAAAHVEGFMAVAAQQCVEFGLGQAGQDGRVGDLVAVEVQDRQHGAVADRVEELVGVPGRGQRPGLRLPVADHAGDQQAGVVQGGAVGVGEGVAEFAALVHGAGDLGGDVAGHTAGEGELAEQPLHACRVPADVRVGLAVAALQPGVGQHGGPAVPRPPDAQRVQVPGRDHPVEVGVHQIQAGRGAPVPEQPGLDVLGPEGLGEQRVGQQVDLARRQVVGGAPVGVQRAQFLVAQYGPGVLVLRHG